MLAHIDERHRRPRAIQRAFDHGARRTHERVHGAVGGQTGIDIE